VPPNVADPEWWDRWATNLARGTNEMFQVIREQVSSQIPCYFIRYEDLVVNPTPVLRELFQFILGVDSIEGTIVEKRIDDYVAKGSTSASVYKLKVDPRANLCRNKGMYTEAQMENFKESCRDFLYFFNYSTHTEEGAADPNTAFLEYTEGQGVQHDPAKLAELFDGFKRNNAEVLSRATEPKTNSFTFNESFPVDVGMRTAGYPQGRMEIKE